MGRFCLAILLYLLSIPVGRISSTAILAFSMVMGNLIANVKLDDMATYARNWYFCAGVVLSVMALVSNEMTHKPSVAGRLYDLSCFCLAIAILFTSMMTWKLDSAPTKDSA